ncbi:ABC transporter ATP-binding protein [Microbispora sp. NPDC049633]|uniref:ABC transporter ATP-binding protein n=1 Tax=Microbispora sp. NPDC049633 TaxID=3154355 RepID=UPI00341D077B
MTGSVVQAVGLTKIFGEGGSKVHALKGVSVEFATGQFTAIMGPSGSGKSTLLHCLAGLETPTSGTIRLTEADLTTLPDDALTKLRRDRVGFLFQSFNLLPNLSAERNILLPLKLARREPDDKWFRTLIAMLGIEHRLSHLPAEMSGGEQQRVAAARALVSKPAVVFADEPTGALDSRAGTDLLGFLSESVRQLGQTIVMVTHDPMAAAYANRVVFMADGQFATELHNPRHDDVLAIVRQLAGARTPGC